MLKSIASLGDALSSVWLWFIVGAVFLLIVLFIYMLIKYFQVSFFTNLDGVIIMKNITKEIINQSINGSV